MLKFSLRALLTAFTLFFVSPTAPVDARPRGVVSVNTGGFNGGKSQIGVNFLQLANDHAFLNPLKSAQAWSYVDNSGAPTPDELDSNGYPLNGANAFSHGGVKTVFFVPTQAERPGNYVIKGTGNGAAYTGMSATVLPTATFTGSVTGGVLTAGAPSGGTIQKGMTLSTGGVVQDQLTGTGGAPCPDVTCTKQAGTYSGLSLTTAGSQSMSVSGGSKTSSSAAVRWVFSTTDYGFIVGVAAASASPITDLKVFHVDDEADINAGEIVGKKFRENWAYMRAGVIRFGDWQQMNTTNVTTWATRRPVNYVFYSGPEYRSSLWAGGTSHSGDDYTALLTPSGWTGLVDKATVIVKFDNDAAGDSSTLNVAGTGAIPIKNMYGDATSSGGNTRPLAGLMGTLVYDATLNAWIKYGGDLGFGNQGLNNGVPPEVMLTVATKIGAHPYITTPYLASDPITDYMSSAATYFRDNGPAWMIPRYEGVNELWNNAPGFYGTRYAWNKAFAYWGASFDQNEWYGKSISLLGQSISQVYSNDRTKYRVMSGVQTSTGDSTSAVNVRMTSAKWISLGPSQSGYSNAAGVGEAYRWVTRVTPANYVSPSRYFFSQELKDGYDWAVTYAANPTAQAVLAASYANTLAGPVIPEVFNLARVKALIHNWCLWGNGNWGGSINIPCEPYEGGYSPDYIPFDWTSPVISATVANPSVFYLPTTYNAKYAPTQDGNAAAGNGAVAGMLMSLPMTITNVTQAASAVVTVSGFNFGSVGKSLVVSGVTGMTQINGTWTISAVSGQTITLSVNSTGFSAYSAAGTGVITTTIASVSGDNVTTDLDGTAYTAAATSTVTLTIASPGVVNWTAHGRSVNDRIYLKTTGALPTGLTIPTTITPNTVSLPVYVKTVINPNSFTVSGSAGGTVIAFTGSQSGTHTAYHSSNDLTWVSSALYSNTMRYASKFSPDLQTQMTQHYSDMLAEGLLFPSQFFFSGPSMNVSNRSSPIGSGQVWGLYDPDVYAVPYSPAVESIRQFNLNWLLDRDINPAANDNSPVGLEKAA